MPRYSTVAIFFFTRPKDDFRLVNSGFALEQIY